MLALKDRFTLDKDVSIEDAVVQLSDFTGKSDQEIKKMIPQLAWNQGRARITEALISDKLGLFITVTNDQGFSASSVIRFTSSAIDFCMQFPAGVSDTREMQRNLELSDLERVGPTKPIGYLAVTDITEDGLDLEEYRRKLEQRGIKTLVITEEWGGEEVDGKFKPYHVEVLYAYDEKSLNDLLMKNARILSEAGWPVEATAFVRNLKESAQSGTELFTVIADAFGDVNNPGRKIR